MNKKTKEKRNFEFECIFTLECLDQLIHKLAEIFEIYITSIPEIQKNASTDQSV